MKLGVSTGRWLSWGSTLLWVAVVLLWLMDAFGHGLPAVLDRIVVVAALGLTAIWGFGRLRRSLEGKRGRVLAAALLLPSLLALALVVRFVGLSHEVEGRYYLDEGTYYSHASAINAGTPFRLSFVYPHLMYYLDALALWLASLFPGAAARLAGTVGVTEPLALSWLLLRGVVGLLSALTVIPVFSIGERIAGRWAGTAGSLLLIFSPLFNDGSHLNICDVPSAVFATFCLLFVARLVGEEHTRDYVLAGVCAGLAAGAKYPAGLVAVAIIAAWLRWRIARRDFSLGLLWAGLAAMATFVAVMPSLVVFPVPAFQGPRGVFFGARQYGKGGWLGVMPGNNALFYAKTLAGSFGLPAAIAGLSGLVLNLFTNRGERARWLWLLPFPLAYLALIGSMNMVVKRNLYPAVPMLAVLLGVGIAAWIGRMGEGSAWRPAVATALLLACVALPARATVLQDVGLASPSTRDVAGAWIRANVPRGSSILKETYTPDLNSREYKVWHRRFVTRSTMAEIRDFDYVLVASGAYGRFLNPATQKRPHQKKMAERYKQIFRSFELVREWTPSRTRRGPVIRLYRPSPK
ncbi:MAG TPA: glycosyltransferase family 39 protein [Thermoanaerobaculia bacterium]